MWRDVAVFALALPYFVGVLLASLIVWPGHGLVVLDLLPVLVVALRKPPRFVMTMTGLAILVDIVGLLLETSTRPSRIESIAAVMVVGYFAVVFATGRHEAIERAARQEEMIRTAERMRQPLTVILTSAQLLLAKENLSAGARGRAEAVERAAKALKASIGELLEQNGEF